MSEIKRLIHLRDPQAIAKNCLIYCRVSTTIQRENLKRQRAWFETYAVTNDFTIEKIYEDIASGMNFKRKGSLKIFNYCQTYVIKAVIIEFKDRLARFEVELIQAMLASFRTELVIVNRVESDFKQEIIDDMIAIIVHFSSRLYSKRLGRKKTTQIKQILKDTAN